MLFSVSGYLGKPVLLPLWLSVPGLHHSCGFLFSDQHRHGVFPIMCRGRDIHGDGTLSHFALVHKMAINNIHTIFKLPQVSLIFCKFNAAVFN